MEGGGVSSCIVRNVNGYLDTSFYPHFEVTRRRCHDGITKAMKSFCLLCEPEIYKTKDGPYGSNIIAVIKQFN